MPFHDSMLVGNIHCAGAGTDFLEQRHIGTASVVPEDESSTAFYLIVEVMPLPIRADCNLISILSSPAPLQWSARPIAAELITACLHCTCCLATRQTLGLLDMLQAN